MRTLASLGLVLHYTGAYYLVRYLVMAGDALDPRPAGEGVKVYCKVYID